MYHSDKQDLQTVNDSTSGDPKSASAMNDQAKIAVLIFVQLHEESLGECNDAKTFRFNILFRHLSYGAREIRFDFVAFPMSASSKRF